MFKVLSEGVTAKLRYAGGGGGDVGGGVVMGGTSTAVALNYVIE